MEMRLTYPLLVVVLENISPTVKEVTAHTLFPGLSGYNQQEYKNSSVAHAHTGKVGIVISQGDVVLQVLE